VGYRDAVETLLGSPVESCSSRLHTTLVPCRYHPFVRAVHLAFDGHRSLALSPDHVWLLVCQGFAAHVNANAAALRKRLVSFEGKQKITVWREHFVKGAMENPWEDVFPEFVEKLRAYLGDTADMLTPRFSTTCVLETAACQITLMDAMKPYFDYGAASGCGIPSFTLEGTEADWYDLRGRAQAFRPFDLSWWIDSLTEVLDEFCRAAAGGANGKWWRSFYKIESMSGGPYVNGHVLKFFPYRKDYATDTFTVRNNFAGGWGMTTKCFPTGLSVAPFRWDVLGPGPRRVYDMEFVGGFVGVRQSPADLTLRPEVGWAVREPGGRA
jgi:hypothetical protein